MRSKQASGCREFESPTVTLTVTAAGANLQYQWRQDGQDLSDEGRITGSTTSELKINGIGAVHGGDYDCVVSNSCGSSTSKAARITACVADMNCDQEVDLFDFFQVFGCWSLQDPCADLDGFEGVDLGDFIAFFGSFDVGC